MPSIYSLEYNMPNNKIFLIGFQEQDNLGIGYIGSNLLLSGYDVYIVDYRLGNDKILFEINRINPIVIGFSIIFQYHIEDISTLISFLRNNNINCHFCAGGHYPSLRYKELLKRIPQLDSIVLFEGEITFLELVSAIKESKNWKKIHGIAFHSKDDIYTTPLRKLVDNLDDFPPPMRPPLREYALNKKYATILAGRGCIYNCVYCSIREFYSRPHGRVKRIRDPQMVVQEMKLLYEEQDCNIFIFQDDDFPISGTIGSKWVDQFCSSIYENGLLGEILWKINCRPDEVDYDLFNKMRKYGLFLVYLGIETGTDQSLIYFNKKMNTTDAFNAVNILNRLGIIYDYGFMLFDPQSSVKSVLDNLLFLDKLCGDGSSPVTFCKMLPYAETKIEKELRIAGRLNGSIGKKDYDFFDPVLNGVFDLSTDLYKNWIMSHFGLLNSARWASYYLSVYSFFYNKNNGSVEEIKNNIKTGIKKSNAYILSSLEQLIAICNSGRSSDRIIGLKNHIDKTENKYRKYFDEIIDQISTLLEKPVTLTTKNRN